MTQLLTLSAHNEAPSSQPDWAGGPLSHEVIGEDCVVPIDKFSAGGNDFRRLSFQPSGGESLVEMNISGVHFIFPTGIDFVSIHHREESIANPNVITGTREEEG
jgi:hypothetical protein